MYWSRVKTVLIIIFAAANIFFIYNLYSQYVTSNLITEETIEDTILLLSSSGIKIDADTVPERRIDDSIIECAYDEDYYLNTLERLTGSDEYTSYIKSGALGQGVKFTVKDTNDTLEFFGSFYLRYIKGGGEGDSESELSEYTAAVSGEEYDGLTNIPNERMLRYPNVTGRTLREIKELLDTLPLSPEGSDDAKASLSVSACVYDSSYDRYILNCVEMAGDYPLYDAEAVVIIEDGEIVYISGNLIFFGAAADYSVSLYDQIDALISERAYIEDKRTDEYTEYRITSLEVVYCINWYSDRRTFYVIPAWRITYSDGTVRVRNALDCNIYNI